MKTDSRESKAESRKPALSDGAKIAACWFVACLLTVGVLSAADITGGYTFSSGEKNVTHTKLNSLGAGTINTTFITDKSAQTAVAADSIIYYASADAAFRKTTLTTLFANVPAFNALSTANIVGNFSVNTDKFTVNATTGTGAFIGHVTVGTNLTVTGASTLVGAVATGALTSTNGQTMSGGQLLTGGTAVTGALTATSTVTVTGAQTNNGNMVLGSDSADTLTINGTLAGTLVGTPTVSLTAVTADTAADSVLISDASDSGKLKMALLSTMVLSTYTTNASVIVGKPIDVAHALGGVPDSVQVFLECTNAERGFAIGDYVASPGIMDSAGINRLLAGASATNVFVLLQTASLYTFEKTNASAGLVTLTATNWNIRVKAARKP